MLLYILVLCLTIVKCFDIISEPKFQVLTPDELMIEVPFYPNKKLLTFRMGVRRRDNDAEDLEFGENTPKNNRIFINDQRLDLKKGDIVNYLLAFSDKEGYHAKTGSYIFDGIYYKKPYGRRHRFRRHISGFDFTRDLDEDDVQSDMESSESRSIHNFFNPPENIHAVTQIHYNTQHERFDIYDHPKQEFYPHHNVPQFPPPFQNRYLPPYYVDCTDHRHDICHKKHDISDKIDLINPSPKCCECPDDEKTTTTSTTTEFPPIDIRSL